MAFEMKPNPPLANGDITKKPWKTYTSSLLDDQGNITDPTTEKSPADRLRAAKEKVIKAKDKIIEETDHVTGGDGAWEKWRNWKAKDKATKLIEGLTDVIKNKK